MSYNEKCQRCGEPGEGDLRTLWMACFYAMDELGLPFEKFKPSPDCSREFFTLRVCKPCRSDWMAAIKTWFRRKANRASCGSGIFVRRNGETVEITEEEWYRENPGREPVRMKPAP